MRSPSWSRRLLVKFLLLVGATFLALIVPGVWLLLGFTLQVDEASLTARIGNLAGRTADALNRHQAYEVPTLARDLMSPLAADRSFLCAEIRTADAVVAALPQAQGCPDSLAGSEIRLPVDATGGWVLRVVFSDAELKNARELEFTLAISAIVLAFMAAMLAGAVGFRFLVGRPLNLLLAAIRESAETGVRRVVVWNSRDELGLVTAAYNVLVDHEVKRERDLTAANERLTRSEADLSALNRDLEARVLDRTRDLERAKLRAELANTSKTQFLRSMSHELRTPLNAIIGFADLMRTGILGPMEHPRYLEFTHDIHDSGRHLLKIIDDLLDIARIEVGQETLREEAVDLDALVSDCHRTVGPMAIERGLSLHIDATAPGLVLRIDRTKIKQVLLNLLSNAIKNTPRGGRVSSAVERSPTDGAGSTGDVELRVTDTGRGMTAEQIPMALTAFTRLDDDPMLPQKGTGLGLPLSRMMVELHGGALTLESEIGRGTQVTLRLPQARVVELALSGPKVVVSAL